MKKNFSIKPAQVSVVNALSFTAAKHEVNNLLKVIDKNICCYGVGAFVAAPRSQKSFILG